MGHKLHLTEYDCPVSLSWAPAHLGNATAITAAWQVKSCFVSHSFSGHTCLHKQLSAVALHPPVAPLLAAWFLNAALSSVRFFMFMLLNTLIHQVGLSLYRSISSATRNIVIANAAGMMLLLCVFLMNGFVIRK